MIIKKISQLNNADYISSKGKKILEQKHASVFLESQRDIFFSDSITIKRDFKENMDYFYKFISKYYAADFDFKSANQYDKFDAKVGNRHYKQVISEFVVKENTLLIEIYSEVLDHLTWTMISWKRGLFKNYSKLSLKERRIYESLPEKMSPSRNVFSIKSRSEFKKRFKAFCEIFVENSILERKEGNKD